MGIVFVWEEQYSVGVPELDKQHRYLFDLANNVQEVDGTQVKKQVMELYKYANAHFKTEEDHMEQIGFPSFKKHKQLHEKFITDLNTMTEKQGDNLTNEVKRFLQNWLLDHILSPDKEYFDYANSKKGSGMSIDTRI